LHKQAAGDLYILANELALSSPSYLPGSSKSPAMLP